MIDVHKLALIGAAGYERQTKELRIDSFNWDDLSKIQNICDYHTVILNLFPIKSSSNVDWERFSEILRPYSVREIVSHGGKIIVLGDPRFSLKGKSSSSSKEKEHPFLDWTGFTFTWDKRPGHTMTLNTNWSNKYLDNYLNQIDGWEYSLISCELNPVALEEAYNVKALESRGLDLDLDIDKYAENRYEGAISFGISLLVLKGVRDMYGTSRKEIMRTSPILFLPKTKLSEEESLATVLKDLCGIETETPEPDWLKTIQVVGQKAIDEEIARVKEQMESSKKQLADKEGERVSVRKCLKLLYEKGPTLEIVARDVLRQLGASVEEPQSPGKEDGWIVVELEGKSYEAVLEIKGTRNDQFSEDGLRQLLDWINRGVEIRKKKYKGLFIGSNCVEKQPKNRPPCFSDGFRKSADLSHVVALTGYDLFLLHELKREGSLNTVNFWNDIFATNGIFKVGPYMPTDK